MLKMLLVGDDFRLLATRAALLSKAGVNTVCCNPAEMMRDLQHENFDLVLLCHSLQDEVAKDVTAVARRWWPQAKLLLMVSDLSPRASRAFGCDGVIGAEPTEMMRQTMALLQRLHGYQGEAALTSAGAGRSSSR